MGFNIMISVVLLVWVVSSIKFVRKTKQGAVIRLGRMITKWSEPLGPGIKWVWWPVETLVRWNVSTGQQT